MSAATAEAKSRLTNLFQGASGQPAQGNDALRYKAPTEPSRSASQVVQQPPPQQQQQAPANAVVFHTSVSLYKYDATSRKYVQMGTSATNLVGCVIVGADVTYSILFYGSDKQHMCEVPLAQWKPTVQPRNYMNFYDDKNGNWSVKFASDAALTEFMKQVFLTKIHVGIWSPARSLDANSLLKEDLGAAAIKNNAGNDDSGSPAASGERVAVEFKCWRVVGNAKAAPADVVTKYPPFEKTNDGEQRKFRIGSGSERIRALEDAVVGMKRGGTRMVLAPPGKTNGQDWYLLEVTLVKRSSRKEGSDRRASEMASAAQSSAPTVEEKRKSRGQSMPPVVNEPVANGNSSRGDIVRYDEDQAKDDLASRIRELEKQLHEKSAPQEPKRASTQGVYSMDYAFNPAPNGFNPYSGAPVYQPPMSTMTQGIMTSSGRPLDGLVMELHAKIDYLIRMAPANGGAGAGISSFGGPVGATDVQSVLRGVERLAGENERLLLQINSQNQQYASYEKRCDELLKQNQRLQDEKRVADEKYQSMASLQLNYNAEISSLTSARDAAIRQSNHLHNEYQQLLTAFYQKQQLSNENEEQKNALDFERQARVRAEKELQKEVQTKSLVEQELVLVKKQLEVVMKMKDSEVQSRRQEMEKQFQAATTAQQQATDERIKTLTQEFQQHEKQLRNEWQTHENNLKTQIETLQTQLAAVKKENADLNTEFANAITRVNELEAAGADAGQFGLADEEKRIYQNQIELLHQQVNDLEAEKFARVQQSIEGDDSKAQEVLAAARAKEEAAERTLAMAEEIKREAQALVARGGAGGEDSGSARQETVTLFKEAVNEMFFRFQDVFEDAANAATPLEARQVLTAIRKVLKQSTKDVVNRLQQEVPPPSQEAEPATVVLPAVVAVTAAAAAAAAVEDTSGHESDASNDEPPPPPELSEIESDQPEVTVATEKEESVADDGEKEEVDPEVGDEETEEEKTTSKEETVNDGDPQDEENEEDDDDAAADDLLFGAASVNPSTPKPTAATPFPRRTEESNASDDDDEFDD